MTLMSHDEPAEVMCGTCDGHGVCGCYCGGDLCVCGELEYECHTCGGEGFVIRGEA